MWGSGTLDAGLVGLAPLAEDECFNQSATRLHRKGVEQRNRISKTVRPSGDEPEASLQDVEYVSDSVLPPVANMTVVTLTRQRRTSSVMRKIAHAIVLPTEASSFAEPPPLPSRRPSSPPPAQDLEYEEGFEDG